MCFHPLFIPPPLPQKLNNPFHYEPHPLCVKAAELVRDDIAARPSWAQEVENGKMFGVLLVETAEHQTGYLAAYSGQLLGRSDWTGYVPPVFNYLSPDGYFKVHEAEIIQINHRITALEKAPHRLDAIKALQQAQQQAEFAIQTHTFKMAKAKLRRDEQRRLHPQTLDAEALLNESRFLKAELRRIKQQHLQRISQAQAALKTIDDELETLKQQRKSLSDALQSWLFAHFELSNGNGERRNLLAIFEQFEGKMPPSGAGECCAPKLLHYAFTHRMRPLSIAEFWCGTSPKGEIRHDGYFYPACRSKCKPVLAYMLQGIEVASNTLQTVSGDALTVLYEDESIAVVNKPFGMPSVKGFHGVESVELLMRRRYPSADSPLIVHRLDMPTSGLMVIAKTKQAHTRLQQQFEQRRVQKQYIALLDGVLRSRPLRGNIAIPMRPDVEDRPRQLADYANGKPALTRYEVVEQLLHRTRVALYPQTGRTHQLRVHCAHPDGLGTPIAGDNLYGQKADRLYLHASLLTFEHPVSGEAVSFSSPPPF